MFEDKTRVLLVVPQQILDRARVFAGSATTRLKRILLGAAPADVASPGAMANAASLDHYVDLGAELRARLGIRAVHAGGGNS